MSRRAPHARCVARRGVLASDASNLSPHRDGAVTSRITPDTGGVTAPPAPTHELRTLGTLELRGPDGSCRAVLAQPKRLALLVHLATLPPDAAVRRDTLLALFWPEHDTTRGRAALRQALRFLRGALGADVLASGEDDALALAPSRIAHDATEFALLAAAGRHEAALELYRGDFLAGFYVAGAAPELEQWMDDTRARLRDRAAACAAALADAAGGAGRREEAVRWARRAVSIVPHDEGAHRRLVSLLDAAGDTGGALDAYEALVRRLARDFEAAPAPETQRLAADIRARAARAANAARPPAPAVPASEVTPPPARRARLSAEMRVVGVLPFTWDGPPDEAYLAAEIAEEVRELLRGDGAAGGMVVAPRQDSPPTVDMDAGTAGALGAARRMGAAAVLEGALRREGRALHIRARLVDGADGAVLGEEAFAREVRDVATLAEVLERMARAISAAMRIALASARPAPLVRRLPRDLEAYNLYLRGRFHWSRRPRETRQALACFELALQRDPLFALAHAAVADAYMTLGSWEASALPSWEAFPRAHAAARKALELDPGCAEAHAALGYAQMHYRWDWTHAEDEFARAGALGPTYAHGHHWHAHHLMATGRVEDSLAAGTRALALDPLDPVLNVHMAWHHWMAREPEPALEWCARTRAVDPQDHWVWFFSGMAESLRGGHGAAVAGMREAVPRSGESVVMVAGLTWALAAAGETREARRRLKELTALAERERVLAYELAVTHAALGETDVAFDWLDRAWEERSAWLAYAAVEPRLDVLRHDPRFAGVLRGVGLARHTDHG